MTLAQQLSLLISRIGQEFKEHNSTIAGNTTGDLSGLSTTAKGNIVAAINEVQATAVAAEADIVTLQSQVAAIDTSSVIDDAASSTTTTYSSDKIVAELAKLKGEILGDESLPTALDTLSEIAAYVQNNKDLIDSLNTLAGDRVATTANQGLTEAEKANALANLGIDGYAGDIQSNASAITQLEGDVNTVQTDIVSLQSVISEADTGLIDQVEKLKTDLGLVTSRVAALEAKTTDADLAALEVRVAANETVVAKLGDVEADLVALFESALQ